MYGTILQILHANYYKENMKEHLSIDTLMSSQHVIQNDAQWTPMYNCFPPDQDLNIYPCQNDNDQ